MTSATKYSLQTVELTVEDLGFLEGANTTQIYKRAGELGLELCPLELGPYLRLEYLDHIRRINDVLWLRGYCADYLHV